MSGIPNVSLHVWLRGVGSSRHAVSLNSLMRYRVFKLSAGTVESDVPNLLSKGSH